MNFTGKECRTHDRWQDESKSIRFHACHALMGLRTSAKSRTAAASMDVADGGGY
jgi:hypothetical protein